MTTVYLVIGECGEYSDRREWICGVWTDEASAQLWCSTANDICRGVRESNAEDANRIRDRFPQLNFLTDYTGTTYRVESAPLAPRLG